MQNKIKFSKKGRKQKITNYMNTVTVSKKRLRKTSLNRYAGQWLAFVDGKIVAHNKTLKGLTKEIDEKKLRKKASVFLVPRKDEGPYILTIL